MVTKRTVLSFLFVLMLSGCGGEESSNDSVTSQVAAVVNGEEVTIHQLNYALREMRQPITADNQEELKQKALSRMIEQTLIIQAAKQAKLDRDPDVLGALEMAKNKVLVETYVKRTMQGVGVPTQDAVEKFYNEHPDIFSNRKLFFYKQVTIRVEKDKLEGLVDKVKNVDTHDELIALVKKESLGYKNRSEVRTSEKIPRPLLKPMNSIKPGDLGYLRMSDGLLIIALEKVVNQPVSLEEARVLIERQLTKESQAKAVNELIKSLKVGATISYQGEFKEVDVQ